MGILCKDNIKPHVHILKNTSNDFQRLQLDKNFFGLQEKLFICVVNDPPSTSSYTLGLNYILKCLEKELIQYSKLGIILICGDFNARTANILDFIPFDSNNYVPLCDQYNSDTEIKHRQSQDDKVDNRGKELIDFCIGQNLRILNGRTFW